MRKRKGTTRILASILCFAMFICSIDLSIMEVQASNDTTIIDVTGLASGAETSHDCSKYLTSKYDSAQHWQECTVCGKVYGILFLNPTLPDDNTNVLPPYAVEDGAYEFETILN